VLFSFSDRYSSGNRPRERGRTFYNRRTQQSASDVSACNSRAQKTLTRDFSSENVDSDYDSSWQDKQMNGRARVCCERFDKNSSFQNNWRDRNGDRRNYNTRGSRSRAYNFSRQQAKTTDDDVADYDNDPWPPASTESTSVCSNSSFTSEVVQLSPKAGEGWCPFNI